MSRELVEYHAYQVLSSPLTPEALSRLSCAKILSHLKQVQFQEVIKKNIDIGLSLIWPFLKNLNKVKRLRTISLLMCFRLHLTLRSKNWFLHRCLFRWTDYGRAQWARLTATVVAQIRCPKRKKNKQIWVLQNPEVRPVAAEDKRSKSQKTKPCSLKAPKTKRETIPRKVN